MCSRLKTRKCHRLGQTDVALTTRITKKKHTDRNKLTVSERQVVDIYVKRKTGDAIFYAEFHENV